MNHQIVILFTLSLLLGSCSTFHTPLSRELLTKSKTRTVSNSSTIDDSSSIDTSKSSSNTLESNVESLGFFDWPVDEARMTRGFLPNKRRPHLGIDLAATKGTPIYSSHQGIVLYTGKDFRGFGKMIIIESSRGWATLYAHLEKIYVTEGQKIKQGEYIASMGRTGRATGVHLHFEIRNKKEPVDPMEYLPKIENVAQN